jgi:hypothetical protein
MILQLACGKCEVDVCARQKNTLLILSTKKRLKSGLFWYVRFWDEKAQEHTIVRPTGVPVEGKRERWGEADDAAKVILAGLKQIFSSSIPAPEPQAGISLGEVSRKLLKKWLIWMSSKKVIHKR